MRVDANGVLVLPCGTKLSLVDGLVSVTRGDAWTVHGVSVFSRDEAVQVSEGIVELLNWEEVEG